MSHQDFLFELGTEELPPKSLRKLSDAFKQSVQDGLQESGLSFDAIQAYAAPRRLALLVKGLPPKQADIAIERKGPSAKAAFDADGNPTKALQGFCRSLGIEPEALDKEETPKGTWLVYRATQEGQASETLLLGIVEAALSKLPIAKRMRWGASKEEFVRPVQWAVALFGSTVLNGQILGVTTGNTTRGHRFHHADDVSIDSPDSYHDALLSAKVMADYEARRAKIESGVIEIAKSVDGQAVIDPDLLDEVCALNEWPVPLIGRFDDDFLKVPAEALISSMKEHQKYFHVVDAEGTIMPYFITIANIESSDPSQVVSGNERVIRPRLADAAFFFETDKKQSLASRREQLKSIVFQTKLGTVYDRTERMAKLSEQIAIALGYSASDARRAACLSKSDLVTEMVLEFTDLQGIMGQYYAKHDGESEAVSVALNEQYMPKYAGAPLPETDIGCCIALAEKIDSLVGLFGINQPPTGTKDPFALRRAALGVLRIIIEKALPLDLKDLIAWSVATFNSLENDQTAEQLVDYLLERMRAWSEELGMSAEVYLSVLARKPTKPLDFKQRLDAVAAFEKRDESDALAAANKRVANILNKQDASSFEGSINPNLLSEQAELDLAKTLEAQLKEVEPLFTSAQYDEALDSLAQLRAPVDRFFDEVMVMAEDEAVKRNRLILLSQLRGLFLEIADISLLAKS